jgi:hypothetical protein
MLKFTYKGRFLTIKKTYKISWIENPNSENKLKCLFYTYKFLFLKNSKLSIFGGISKFRLWADFGKIWQFWAVLGRICCIGNMVLFSGWKIWRD